MEKLFNEQIFVQGVLGVLSDLPFLILAPLLARLRIVVVVVVAVVVVIVVVVVVVLHQGSCQVERVGSVILPHRDLVHELGLLSPTVESFSLKCALPHPPQNPRRLALIELLEQALVFNKALGNLALQPRELAAVPRRWLSENRYIATKIFPSQQSSIYLITNASVQEIYSIAATKP